MKRVPQLDAVRGIAVLMVLVHNTGRDPALHLGLLAKDGWMGVDLFFVLSGYLITCILLKAKGGEGYFRNFYVRRCLRIWPLYFSVLLLMFVAIPVLRPSAAKEIFEPRSMPWWSYLIFLQNFFIPAITKATASLAVTWSLAVEEQFYLFWPLLIFLFTESQLRKIAIGIVCLSPVLRFYLAQSGVDVYPNTFCRLDGLMAGALLALILQPSMIAQARHTEKAWIGLLIATPLALLTAGRAEWAVFSFTSIAAACFVYLAMYSQQRWLQAVFRNRFLVYTGIISYAIYMLEKIPPDIFQSLHLDKSPWVTFFASIAVTYTAAIISWNVLEKPCLRLKRFFEARGSAPAGSKEFVRPAAAS